MVKNVIKIVMYLASFQLLIAPLRSFSHAQDACTICHGSHNTLEQYRSFVLDILNQIETHTTTGTPANGTPGLFQNGALPVDQSNTASSSIRQFGKNINQSVQTTAAILSIFAGDSVRLLSSDLIPGLGLAISNQTLQRDMDMLLELDQLITEKKLQLGLGGGYFETVHSNDIQSFQTIKNNYGSTLLYTQEQGGLWIGTNTTYGQILGLLHQTQRHMKRFVSYGSTNAFINPNGSSKVIDHQEKTLIQFDPEAITRMQQAYTCVRGPINQCDSQTKQFGSIIGEEISEGTNKIIEASKKFGTSAKKLGQVFRGGANITEQTGTSRNGLLDNGKSTQDTSFFAIGKRIRTNIAGIPELGKIQRKKNKQQNSDNNTNNQAQTEESIQEKNNLLQVQHRPNSMEKSLEQSLTETLDSYHHAQQHAVLAQPTDITMQFPALCTNIETIISSIGNKEANQTIIQNLGIACEKQCANLGGTCRY